MDFVFNELSLVEVKSRQQAENAYKTFFELAVKSENLKCKFDGIHRIITMKMFSLAKSELYPKNTFEQYLSRLSIKERSKKLKFFRMIGTFQKPVIYPEYSYKKQEALGLGYAYKNDLIALSYNATEEWNTCFVEIDELRIEKGEFKKGNVLKVRHLSSDEHIECHKRIFKHHRKHNWNNPAKNESPLLYNPTDEKDIKVIQNLLNCAIPFSENSERLCFFDENYGKYILFYRESRKKGSINYNNFHAFHTENKSEIPQITKEKMNRIITV